MNVQELKATFEAAYGKATKAVYFSPGLVHMIGEYMITTWIGVSKCFERWKICIVA